MFQTMRIFVRGEVHTLKKADLDMLNDVFLYKLTDQFLILETSRRTEKKGKSKTVSPDFVVWLAHFLKLVAKESERFFFTEFLQPPEWDTAKWVVQQTPYLTGRAIGMKEAQYLIDLAGNDTATLYSELQKIDVHLPEGKPISRTAITNITGATRQMTPYELAAAVGKKDMVRVLEIIDSLYTGSVYVPQYIAALFRHFWAMYRIRTYAADFPNDIKNLCVQTTAKSRAKQDCVSV